MHRFCIHPDDDFPENHLSETPIGPMRKPVSRDERRHIERYLFEPGYAMAYLFLVERAALAKEG